MALSLDFLNTTLEDLKGPASFGFVDNLPIWKSVFERAGSIESGDYITRIHIGGVPNKMVSLANASDRILPKAMNNVTTELKVQPWMLSGFVHIPIMEMQRQDGKNGVIKIMEAYPQAMAKSLAATVNYWLLNGGFSGVDLPNSGYVISDPSEMYGLLTLNGAFAAGTSLGTTNGLLDFAAVGSQTDTVQNAAKSSAKNYVNQYGAATGWATDTFKVLQRVYARCAEFNNGVGPDVLAMDTESFEGFMDNRRDIVRLNSITDSEGKTSYLASAFGVGTLYGTAEINLANFAGTTGADGLCYMINTRDMDVDWFGGKGIQLGKFEDKSTDQRVVSAPIDLHLGFIHKNLRSCGVVGGTKLA